LGDEPLDDSDGELKDGGSGGGNFDEATGAHFLYPELVNRIRQL
jgi:hypothetical protein